MKSNFQGKIGSGHHLHMNQSASPPGLVAYQSSYGGGGFEE